MTDQRKRLTLEWNDDEGEALSDTLRAFLKGDFTLEDLQSPGCGFNLEAWVTKAEGPNEGKALAQAQGAYWSSREDEVPRAR